MYWLLVLLVYCGFTFGVEKDDCSKPNKLKIYQDYGNVTITGIFSGRGGENCSRIIDQGLEEQAAAIWTVTALNNFKYLPGLKIGLSLFEACNSQEISKKALIQAVLQESCNGLPIGILSTPEIDQQLKPFAEAVNKTVTRIEHLIDMDTILEMLMQLLTNLRWTTVNRFIAEDDDILHRFSVKTTDEGICVYDEVLITDRYGINNEVLYPQDFLNETFLDDTLARDQPLVVVIAKSDNIEKVLVELDDAVKNVTGRWFLIPTDFTFTVPLDNLPDNTFILLPLIEKKDALETTISTKDIQNDFLNHREATKSPLFLKIASAIIDTLQPFKTVQEMYCPNMNPRSKEPCLEVYKLTQDLKSKEIKLNNPDLLQMTPEKIENVLKTLKIVTSDNDEMFLFITQLIKNGRSEDVAISQIYDSKTKRFQPTLLIIKDKDQNVKSRIKRMFQVNIEDIKETRKKQKEKEIKNQPLITELFENNYNKSDSKKLPFGSDLQHPCLQLLLEEEGDSARNCGICQNFVKYHTKTTQETVPEKRTTVKMDPFEVTWRFRMWVAINASVAFIGVICTLAIMIFIIFRICKGDILEGSPYFTFLILISIILMYVAILPYSLEAFSFEEYYLSICDLRIIGPTLSYSILFSLLLSRSLMLASSDQEGGFMSHVNGYLQSVLCFFMCGVQIALSTQYWYFDSYLNNRVNTNCFDMYQNNKILVLLGYSFFLLGILTCVSPFMFRCKRNYKEGMFFTIAIFLILIDWSIWITFYFFLPVEYKDAAIAFGLTATATTIVLTVFIPRTYLMVVAIVRDKIANTLPPLSCSSTANISETNYRSNQALYDSVTVPCQSPKSGMSNPNFYSVNPSDSLPSSPKDTFYANQAVLNGSACSGNHSGESRKKVLRGSRTGTPENTYESYESPTSPRNITKF